MRGFLQGPAGQETPEPKVKAGYEEDGRILRRSPRPTVSAVAGVLYLGTSVAAPTVGTKHLPDSERAFSSAS